MKIVSFKNGTSKIFGVVDSDGQVIHYNSGLVDPESFTEVMKWCKENMDLQEEISKVELTAPVLPTKNVICIGKNYHDHILEFDGSNELIEEIKENPIFFTKALSSICGPEAEIEISRDVTNEVDYEGELGVVIGKICHQIEDYEADEYIFGYTIINDLTARDLQKKHKQWFLGKSLDNFCPIGPYVVSKDEIVNPQDLQIRTKVNGEIRQDDNTGLMIHKINEQIAFLSKRITLNPGDVIATGTPKGVGMGFENPIFLKAGDLVEISIDGIGVLKNSIIE